VAPLRYVELAADAWGGLRFLLERLRTRGRRP